jgi:hypothetical protein
MYMNISVLISFITIHAGHMLMLDVASEMMAMMIGASSGVGSTQQGKCKKGHT